MRPVNVDLLNLTIETQLEAGVSEMQIRHLIYAFAVEEPAGECADEPVGFLWVDDIPPGYRGDFLTHLLALSPPGKALRAKLAQPKQRPFSAATDLCRAAAASLRLTRLFPALTSS